MPADYVTAFNAAGHAELAMRYLGDAPREQLPELFMLMVQSGRFHEAIAVLEGQYERQGRQLGHARLVGVFRGRPGVQK